VYQELGSHKKLPVELTLRDSSKIQPI